MASTSRDLPERRPYQGYPYVNPMVIDVPSINAETAAQWANLPRRPIGGPSQQNSAGQQNSPNAPSTSSQNITKRPSRLQEPTGSKQNAEESPVIYIKLPEETGNACDTQQNLQDDGGEDNLTFVEDTILYDPFENRQIEINRTKESTIAEETEESISTGTFRPAPAVPSPFSPSTPNGAASRPRPPNLDFNFPYNPSQNPPTLPGYSTKGPQIYRPVSIEDGFTLTPLPVNDYQRPPPSYTEVVGTSPPRVEVVVDQPTVGLPSSNRKLTTCQQCGLRVNTLVIREVGMLTHIIAITPMLLCLFPFTAFIYCTDYLKNRVHYCPNCNFKIGKESPCCCGDMKYYKLS